MDDTLHDHTDKLDKLREVNFGPKSLQLKERLKFTLPLDWRSTLDATLI